MDNELYHYGVKGMRWGVRKKTHTPTKEPEGFSLKKQTEQEKTYNEYRHASGAKKKELKKKLISINKDGVKSANEYRKWAGDRPNNKYKDVTSAVVSGRKLRDGMTVATHVDRIYDPNRRMKNAIKRGSTAAAAVLTYSLGKKAANKLAYTSGHTANLVRAGSNVAATYLAGHAISGTINDVRNEYRISRYNRQVDKSNRKR